MKINRATEYGILGLIALAEEGSRSVLGIEEIARRQAVPKKFMAKIFQKMANAKLVCSVRGVKGGFRLAKSPSGINLRDIVEALEGPIILNQCQVVNADCHRHRYCQVARVWRQAQLQMLKTLRTATLNKLIKKTSLCPPGTKNGKIKKQ